MKALFLALVMCLAGCSGVQGPGGTPGVPGWTVTVSVTISAARVADVAVRQFVRDESTISAVDKERVTRVLDIVDASLAAAAGSLAVYQTDQSTPSQCKLHADIEAVVTNLIQVNSILVASAVHVPPVVLTVLGSLGSIADAIAPTCPSTVAPASARIFAAVQEP